MGTGGAGFTKNSVTPYPEWNEFVTYQWGYAIVTAVNASYLDWKWVNSIDGLVGDRMVVTQLNPNVLWVLPPSNSRSSSPLSLLVMGLICGGSVMFLVSFAKWRRGLALIGSFNIQQIDDTPLVSSRRGDHDHGYQTIAPIII